MLRGQLFRLSPTPSQEDYLRRAAGVSRHAYNWALGLSDRYYRRYRRHVGWTTLMRKWNRHKRAKKAWAANVSKVISQTAIANLDVAFGRFFKGTSGHPRFKSKRAGNASFQVAAEASELGFIGKKVRLPVVGQVRYRGRLRWPNGIIKRAHIRQRGGDWILSVVFELPAPNPPPHPGPSCGIDLGVTTFATVVSNGRLVEVVDSPRPRKNANKKFKRFSRGVSRRRRGGKNREKALARLARLHLYVAAARADFIHKLTHEVVSRYSRVALEDLAVAVLARGKARKHIYDMGWREFRRQLEYKATTLGVNVILIDRFYPSSKTCSSCGRVKTKLGLGERVWRCECGVIHNRDVNAAINIEKLGRVTPEVTPAETGVPAERKRGRSRSTKQERPMVALGRAIGIDAK